LRAAVSREPDMGGVGPAGVRVVAPLWTKSLDTLPIGKWEVSRVSTVVTP